MKRKTWSAEAILESLRWQAEQVGGSRGDALLRVIERALERDAFESFHVLTSHYTVKVFRDLKAVSDHVPTHVFANLDTDGLLEIGVFHAIPLDRAEGTCRDWRVRYRVRSEDAMNALDECLQMLRRFSEHPELFPSPREGEVSTPT